ncbi:MAG: hypothetical protein GY838_01590 [bacterium]|nr:hypothetical protein [bacterium]
MRTAITSLVAFLVLAAGATTASAERVPVTFQKHGLSGPRFGLTYVPGDTELYRQLKGEGMDRVVSQFGWHFERRVIPKGGGPQFVVEFVPMLAGVEYGKFVPNLTLAMGVRMPGGFEFGLGPNFFVAKTPEDSPEIRTSLLTAVGKSFDYGGVSIPINIALATAPVGTRVSIIFGYAIGKTERPAVAAVTER